MLVLTRKLGEEILIGEGDSEIRLVIKRVRGGSVRLGIAAPVEVKVRRAELKGRPVEVVSEVA